jgi:hypothetical protein
MRKQKNGLKIALDTLNNADWRIYILLSGIVILCIGLVPLIERDSFNTLRYIALKKFFIDTNIMAAAYLLTGLLLIVNLRARRLAYIAPIGIFLLGYYIFTQIAILKAYSYGILTSGITCALMIAAFIKAGGFLLNRDLNDLQLTSREVDSIYITEKAVRAVRMANEAEKDDEISKDRHIY